MSFRVVRDGPLPSAAALERRMSGGCAAALPKPQRPSRSYRGSERAPSAAPFCAAAREFRRRQRRRAVPWYLADFGGAQSPRECSVAEGVLSCRGGAQSPRGLRVLSRRNVVISGRWYAHTGTHTLAKRVLLRDRCRPTFLGLWAHRGCSRVSAVSGGHVTSESIGCLWR